MSIPKLPDKLFSMICKPEPKTAVDKPVQSYDQKTVMQLCECISVKQLDDYTNWIQLGMTLKNIGAPLELWEQMRQNSKKYKQTDCLPDGISSR